MSGKIPIFPLLKLSLPALAASTVLAGTIYTAVQQDFRQGANDPQIQIAEDTAAKLDFSTPSSLVSSARVDLRTSLAAFTIIYDKSGGVLASSAILDGKNPNLPKGVFENVTSSREWRQTWQPAKGVRIAAVIAKASNSDFVLVGRSLREVENRESQLEAIVGFGWLASLAATILASWVVLFWSKKV